MEIGDGAMRLRNEATDELDRYRIEDLPKDKAREIEEVLKQEVGGDFTKKIVITMLILFVVFTAIILWNFVRTGMEPSTLIVSVTGLFAGEFGLLAWLMKHKRDSVYKEIIYREARSPNQDFMPFTESDEDDNDIL